MNRILRAAATAAAATVATVALVSAPANAYTIEAAHTDEVTVTLDHAELISIINSTSGARDVCQNLVADVHALVPVLAPVEELTCAITVTSCAQKAVEWGVTSVHVTWAWTETLCSAEV